MLSLKPFIFLKPISSLFVNVIRSGGYLSISVCFQICICDWFICWITNAIWLGECPLLCEFVFISLGFQFSFEFYIWSKRTWAIILSFNHENGGCKQLKNDVIFIGFAITLHVWFRRFVLVFFVEISWNVILWNVTLRLEHI